MLCECIGGIGENETGRRVTSPEGVFPLGRKRPKLGEL
jgi:hypothetical protein